MENSQLQELANKAKTGDANAAEQLLTELTPLMAFVVNKYFLPDGEREDLMQVARMAVLEAIEDYDGVRQFGLWAGLVINRRVIVAVKVAHRGKHLVLTNASSLEFEDHSGYRATGRETALDPVHPVVSRDIMGRLVPALKACLSSFEWDVVRLLADGLTYKEIAAHLQVRPKSVDNAINGRIRKNKIELIRRCFQDAGYELCDLPLLPNNGRG